MRFFGFCLLLSIGGAIGAAESVESKVMTVSGPIEASALGSVLSHEHIIVDFGGAAIAGPNRYDVEEVFQFALAHLLKAKSVGVDTFVECTPAFVGRDVTLLKRLSQASGMKIITNTGLYGAGNDRYVPAFAFEESEQELAARWIGEWNDGIDSTEVRPGFIKTAFDHGAPSEIDLKLFRSAVLASKETGLTIATHTGGNIEAVDAQLEVLTNYGVSPEKWIWVHAQNIKDFEECLPALQSGGWVSFDGVSEKSLKKHVTYILEAKKYGYLNQILVSHDAGWYRVGEEGGGPDKFRDYLMVHTVLFESLREAGLSEEEIEGLHKRNPQKAFGFEWK